MARAPSKVTGIPGGSLSLEGGFMQAHDPAADMLTIQGSASQAGDLLNLSEYVGTAGSTLSTNEVFSINSSGESTWSIPPAFFGGIKYGLVAIDSASTGYTVLSSNSGKIHIVPGWSSGSMITLPDAAAGLFYKFFVRAVTSSDGLSFLCNDPGVLKHGAVIDGSSVGFATAADGVGGASFEFFSDGSFWYLNFLPPSATATELLSVGTT